MARSTSRHGRRLDLVLAAAVTAALALSGAAGLAVGLRSHGGPPQPQAAPTATGAPQSAPPVVPSASSAPPVRFLAWSRPVGLRIPSLGISSGTLVGLGKNPDGTLQVPVRFDTPGWYDEGPAPGQLGPAVIAGHVDSHSGPGVFFRLGALRPGATVLVPRADGSTARFTVDRVASFPKARFPSDQVYGPTARPELRLITCGGAFDSRTGHYVDNVVAFAHLT